MTRLRTLLWNEYMRSVRTYGFENTSLFMACVSGIFVAVLKGNGWLA